MLDRTKYAEYLDSATIYNFINGLGKNFSEKIFSLRFRKPFLASGERFFDNKYSKEGVFVVLNSETRSIVRFGFSCKDARSQMYHYLARIPKDILCKCECGIINTSNGEQKKLAILLERVVRFEIDYHNYLLLKDSIEEEKQIPINILEKLPPYTGRNNKYGREWSIPKQDWKSGVYIIFKNGEVDYIGKGKRLAKRLYSHFEDRSSHKRYTANGEEYGYTHIFYSKEEEVCLKVAIIPVYRKMVKREILFTDQFVIQEESDSELNERLLSLENRLIGQYFPARNKKGKSENPLLDLPFKEEKLEKEEFLEEPPF